MRILSVVGARPQFVKLAPIAQAARRAGIEHVIVHTGQHYDHGMSQSFFDELGISEPDVNLAVGSGAHGAQTGAMMAGLEPVFTEQSPDWVLVYGDTNSTLAAAVVATKMHLPLAHLEAGLRSFNRRMPEEHNRVLTDHAADLCLAPAPAAMNHLAREGLGHRSALVGDVMVDVLLGVARDVARQPVSSPVDSDGGEYTVATIHRPDNTDDAGRLRSIVTALQGLSGKVYLAAHPRLVKSAERHDIDLHEGAVEVVPPLSYPQLVQALGGATHVVTDSGGLQKEAFVMGVPTTTVRSETEWTETLSGGWNVLATEPDYLGEAARRSKPTSARGEPYGIGHAAEAAIETIKTWKVS